MRQLATIREISDIRPIPGADRIVVAQVDGWECVVDKDEFNKGDTVIYIEVDSVLPERPEFEFMRNRKFRVRTIKLRGQISQGLVLPLSILPANKVYAVGADVTRELGITKYDQQAAQEKELLVKRDISKKQNIITRFLMRFNWYRKYFDMRKAKTGFPKWISKTDEPRIQNLTEMFEREKNRGTTFSVTEKLDGQSATYFLRKISKRKYEFGVCSRNIRLETPDESSYWKVAFKYNIEDALRGIIGDQDSVVLQGEICGPGIQKNKYRLNEYSFYAFNLIFPDYKCTTGEMAVFLNRYAIPTVPLLQLDLVLPEQISDLVEYSKGLSVVDSKQKREGVVIRNMLRDISFKVINPDFLLEDSE